MDDYNCFKKTLYLKEWMAQADHPKEASTFVKNELPAATSVLK